MIPASFIIMIPEIFRNTLYAGLFFLFVTFLMGCNDSTLNPAGRIKANDEILEVRYGTSFGFCAGYCIRTVEITPTMLKYNKEGWGQEVPVLSCLLNYTPAEFSVLTGKINLNGFFQLDEVIGCPDCTDGGTEWIEIRTIEKMHKVSFEYMDEPSVINGYIDDLRAILSDIDSCAE